MNKLFFVALTFLFFFSFANKVSNAETTSSVETKNTCQIAPYKNQIFKDLKHVALIIYIPSNYDLAVKCHGKERECAASGISPAQKEQIKEGEALLKTTYSNYPPALHREHLTNLFSEKIKKRVMPFVRDDKCREPDITIIQNSEYNSYIQKEDTLTIVAKVSVWSNITPNVAVMRINLYRAPVGLHVYQSTAFAVPVNLDSSKIKDFLNYYVESALPSAGSPLQ